MGMSRGRPGTYDLRMPMGMNMDEELERAFPAERIREAERIERTIPETRAAGKRLSPEQYEASALLKAYALATGTF